jgi:hypothetical protein
VVGIVQPSHSEKISWKNSTKECMNQGLIHAQDTSDILFVIGGNNKNKGDKKTEVNRRNEERRSTTI